MTTEPAARRKRRWHSGHGEVDSPYKVESFLREYESLCLDYEMALSHEDSQGSFLIADKDVESNIAWAAEASLKRDFTL